MSWTAEQQELFDALRARELSGILTPAEHDQLKALYAWLEAEESLYLSPTIAQMKVDQTVLREKLESVQTENEKLLRQELDQAQTINAQMQKRIWALEIELAELRELIARLSA